MRYVSVDGVLMHTLQRAASLLPLAPVIPSVARPRARHLGGGTDVGGVTRRAEANPDIPRTAECICELRVNEAWVDIVAKRAGERGEAGRNRRARPSERSRGAAGGCLLRCVLSVVGRRCRAVA